MSGNSVHTVTEWEVAVFVWDQLEVHMVPLCTSAKGLEASHSLCFPFPLILSSLFGITFKKVHTCMLTLYILYEEIMFGLEVSSSVVLTPGIYL